jgi:hypothetical protein|tara:strand:- start:4350 stop:4652 length:303 start_codon:yes stop_codon:yes gene_type:complete
MDKNTQTISELEALENPMLAMTVQPDSESKLKNYLVEYTGTKLDNEEVTVQMISEVLATEFPEFVFAFAEENFLRGYQLGLDDAEILFKTETDTVNGTTD